MTWSKIPPTYREWLDAHNHGAWWIKFRLMEETTELDEDGEKITWPEAWITDIVTITSSYENGALVRSMMKKDGEGVKLHASGMMIKFDLDDEEQTKHLYWQAVKPPDDDVRDERPETV